MTTATFRTAPAIGYSLIKEGDTRTPTNQVIYHGLQPDGRYLSKIDLDSHSAGQDADAARMALARQFPTIHSKVSWHRSKGGKGWNGYIYTNSPMPHGKLYDLDGRHIGELLASDTSVSIPPEGLAPGWLSATERELLPRFWSVDAPSTDSDRWSGRAAEGMRYIEGAYQYHYAQADLVRFLKMHCNQVDPKTGAIVRRIGADYLRGDALNMDVPNRSDAAGNLMQTILLYIRRAYPNAGFLECIQRSYRLWETAESFGKALDKDYSQTRDGASLIAQIIHGDRYGPKDAPRQWRVPHWAKSHPTPPSNAPAPAAEPAPRRPPHRPVGDHAKMLRKIRRYIELRAFESDDRKVYYHVDDLAAAFGIARRTMQAYLSEIPEIRRGQDPGPGGRAWLIWGADNSEDQPTNHAGDVQIWGADASAIERVPMQESADRSPVCKVDHQDLSAPAPAAGGGPAGPQASGDLPSAPAGARTQAQILTAESYTLVGSAARAAAELEEKVRREAEALARCWEGKVAGSKRKVKAKTQRFLGRDGSQVGAKYQKRKNVAEMPAPTPYHARMRMPVASLPEPPAAPVHQVEPAPSADRLLATLYARQAQQALLFGGAD